MVEILGEVEEGDLAALLNGWKGHHDRADGLDWALSLTPRLKSPG